MFLKKRRLLLTRRSAPVSADRWLARTGARTSPTSAVPNLPALLQQKEMPQRGGHAHATKGSTLPCDTSGAIITSLQQIKHRLCAFTILPLSEIKCKWFESLFFLKQGRGGIKEHSITFLSDHTAFTQRHRSSASKETAARKERESSGTASDGERLQSN